MAELFGLWLLYTGLGAAAVTILTMLAIAVTDPKGRDAYRRNWKLTLHIQARLVSLSLIAALFGAAIYKGSACLFITAIVSVPATIVALFLLTRFLPWPGAQQQWEEYKRRGGQSNTTDLPVPRERERMELPPARRFRW